MSRWPGPQGLVGTVQRILGDGVPLVTTEDLKMEAEQPQDVSSSRSDNTWETNTTGYPLLVYASASGSGAGAGIYSAGDINTSQSNNVITVNNVKAHDSGTIEPGVSFVVPPGHHYKVNWEGTLQKFFEQRIGVSE